VIKTYSPVPKTFTTDYIDSTDYTDYKDIYFSKIGAIRGVFVFAIERSIFTGYDEACRSYGA